MVELNISIFSGLSLKDGQRKYRDCPSYQDHAMSIPMMLKKMNNVNL